MSTNQASFPLVGSPFEFKQHGASGATISEPLPHTASVADDLCFIKSMLTEAINHGLPGFVGLTTQKWLGKPSHPATFPGQVLVRVMDR